MADLRISDAPELLESEVQGGLKIPTGGFGNKAINMTTVASWVVKDKDLPSKDYVDTAVAQGNQGLSGHVNNKNNPHEVTKEQVGLGNVNNTADADKPISNAVAAALDTKADKSQLNGLVTSDALDGKADKANTYTKSEVYTKDQVDGVVDDIYQSLEDTVVKNGAALQYDPQVVYNDGAIVVDNGALKKVEGGNLELAVKADGVQVGESTLDVFAAELTPIPTKLSRENVSVWDFFTTEELATYKAAPNVFDAYRPIQEFLTYITDNDAGTAYINGSFSISNGLILGGTNGTKTKQLIGFAKFTALNAIDVMFKNQAGQDFTWLGACEVYGTGSVSFKSRTCRRGFELGSNTVNSARNRFTAIKAERFYEGGVVVPQIGSLSSLGFVRVSDCGSGYSAATYSLESSFTFISNSGDPSSASQRSLISVDVLSPESIEADDAPMNVIINDESYHVYDIDRTNKTLSIFPWLDINNQTGTLRYDFGGGVIISGGDSSVLHADMIDAVRCSTALVSAALYAPVVDRIVAQFVGNGVKIGLRPDAGHIGGEIGNLYVENVNTHILRCTRAQLNFNILSNVALDVSKFKTTCAPRNNANKKVIHDNFQGIVYQNNGHVIDWQTQKSTDTANNKVDVTSEYNSDFLFYGNNANLILANPNEALSDNFGRYKRRVVVYGSAIGGAPIVVNFTVENSATYTINQAQQTTLSFNNFIGFAEFDIIYRSDTKRFIISQVSNKNPTTVTTTYDPPSIAAKATEITTVALQGVAVGQPVIAAFSRYNAGIKINAVVSEANTVTVSFENTTDAAIDLASGTLTVKAI